MYNLNPDYLVTIQQVIPGKPAAQGQTAQQAQVITIQAPMPEEFAFDVRSNYEAPFAQGLFGNSTAAQIARFSGHSLVTQAMTAQIWQGSNDTELSLELDFRAENDPISEVRDPILKLLKLATPSIDRDLNVMTAPGPRLDVATQQAVADIASAAASAGAETIQGVANVFGVGGLASSVLSYFKKGNMGSADTTLSNGQGNSLQQPNQNYNIGTGQFWKQRIQNAISIQIGRMALFDCVVITNVQKTYEAQFEAETGLPMHARVQVQFKPFFTLVQEDLDQIFTSSRI